MAAGRVSDLVPEAVAALRRAWGRGNPSGAIEILRSFGYLRNAAEHRVSPTETRDLDAEISEILDKLLEHRREAPG